MGQDFDIEQITSLKTSIRAYREAQLAFATNGAIQEYRFDTGQTVQLVKRTENIDQKIQSLMNELATLEARVYGSGVMYGRPSF